MKKILVVPALLLALSMTACGPEPEVEEVPDGGVRYMEVDRPDGSKVECIVYSDFNKAGMDCAWPAERKGN